MKLEPGKIETIKNYFRTKPVLRAYLFGSYSRKEAGDDSDIDILVELDHSKPIGLRFFEFQEELQELLGKEVDLVTDEGLSKFIRPYIEQDKILIYER